MYIRTLRELFNSSLGDPYQYDPDMSASSVHPTLSMTHGIGNVGQVHNGESYINKSLEMIKTIDK